MSQSNDPFETNAGDPSSWQGVPIRDLTDKTLGDYHVERLLGHGGMGEVYLARQLSLNRQVALKVLKPDLARNPTNMARFEAEAGSAAKLNHPNIVHIYSLGTVNGVRYIAMEYVQGTNLREYLQKKGIPDLPLALAIMRQSALAVGAAGEAGLIHRDIKPENLLLTKKGQVKVADFGLSRAAAEENRLHLTQPGMTLGTPMYMSPEQVQGKEVDHRSDLYSLGVTFYHMLAGKPPFRADTALAMALKHVHEQPMSLAVHRPDLPSQLVDLVMKLMAKSPADRYQSAAEMLRDFAQVKEIVVRGGLGKTGQTRPLSAQTATARTEAMTEPAATMPLTARLESWKPGVGVLSAIGAVCLGLGALFGWMARSEDLLSASSTASDAPPALWLANWRTIRKQPVASEQYRFALNRSRVSDREAAWLAVAGWFPKDHEWTYPAYLQLARHYLRINDQESLRLLGAELKTAETKSDPPREKWLGLIKMISAAQAAVEGDGAEVAATIQDYRNLNALDPALAEFALEAILKTLQSPSGSGSSESALQKLKDQLIANTGPLKIPRILFNDILLNEQPLFSN